MSTINARKYSGGIHIKYPTSQTIKVSSSYRIPVTKEKQKLIDIIIDCVKIDLKNGINVQLPDETVYDSEISLRTLQSVTAFGYYTNLRKRRLNNLREYYKNDINFIWKT